MDKDLIANRARAAQSLKDSFDYKYVMQEIDREVFEKFKATPLSDPERVKNIHAVGQALNLLNTYLEKFIGDALVEAELDE